MTGRRFPVFGTQPWVMGILNVTPDSFSDGGRWTTTAAAVARGRELVRQGAHIVDVGGESTRPGAHRVDAAEETARVVPVIRELAADGVLCSVDTTRASVAAAAAEAGVAIVNDVSGGLADPDMARAVADAGLPWILMHWRGPSDVMSELAVYGDVGADVYVELSARIDAALAAGVDERSLILDPGLGFAKNAQHNWDLLDELSILVSRGLPVLVGASRKRFLGELLAEEGTLRPPAEREAATAAISVIAAEAGVWGVRVHEPRPTADAFAVRARLTAPGTIGAAPGGRHAGADTPARVAAPSPLLTEEEMTAAAPRRTTEPAGPVAGRRGWRRFVEREVTTWGGSTVGRRTGG
jgi:dihydropteroate synthase